MLVIRLQRVGKKNQPNFRVVLAEKTAPVKGKFIEILGHYNPRLKTRHFNKERILYWLSKGAKASATVHNLLVTEKIIEAQKVKAWRPKKKEKTEEKRKEIKEKKKIDIKEKIEEKKRELLDKSDDKSIIENK